ncbi:ornithine cyclodeaminase [Roseobacter sp. AzwK-3b]|uniref:iron-containing alcohol dehydrogenase n=1 Tax=Roseobacter sp. AzwK-3b TaxID=351016 RepID=UPI00015696FC|nr:iron-containing alcohol dehydrogenase [Roseobacter sp. AzwK-3b]EDM71861.1 ornithine cyclodeaminase [Roseobacter sp. AzwK-3b]
MKRTITMTLAAFSFLSPGEILFGRGMAQQAASRIAQRADRVLLVHGAAADRVAWLRNDLAASGVQVEGFAVPQEPDVVLIEAGVAAARRCGARVIVACGGGSVIDAGKAIAALVPATRPMLEHLEVVGQGLPLDHAPLPFVAIPTTAGTGAEVTKNAVIAVPEARRKVSLRDPRMIADVAIVDPALTDGTPWAVTLASGLDAVTQVIEPYVSPKANALTDALCRDAIPRGLQALCRLQEGESSEARDAMALVSLYGGLALANAALGAVHGLAGPIGGMSGAPHGAVCGRLLPFVLECNAERATGDASGRLAQVSEWIADALGGTADQAPHRLVHWAEAAGLPGLAAMGVRAADHKDLAQAAVGSSSMKGNPVPLEVADLVALMRDAA